MRFFFCICHGHSLQSAPLTAMLLSRWKKYSTIIIMQSRAVITTVLFFWQFNSMILVSLWIIPSVSLSPSLTLCDLNKTNIVNDKGKLIFCLLKTFRCVINDNDDDFRIETTRQKKSWDKMSRNMWDELIHSIWQVVHYPTTAADATSRRVLLQHQHKY